VGSEWIYNLEEKNLKFKKNIIEFMQKKDKFQNVNNEEILIKEFEKIVFRNFSNLKNIENFILLLNLVNKVLYKSSKNISLKFITYHAYHNKNLYSSFKISKKSGGTRTINTPIKSLKNIQTTISFILSCIYKSTMVVHGFTKNRSIITNAQHHVNKNYVYNIDLEDFFGSIHKARIEKRLQIAPYNLVGEKAEIATLISRLVTQKDIKEEIVEGEIVQKKYAKLPQGAPTSPIISNIICEKLDRRLLGLAKRFKVKYTRYADDITFSSMHNVYQKDSDFLIELERIIEEQNFKINPKKTRLQKRGYRQEVTGLIVNEKVNVDRRYIKQLRAMIYSIEKFGLEKAENIFKNYYLEDKGHIKEEVPSMQNVLFGKLEYLKMVKGFDNNNYLKLKKRYDNIFTNNEKKEKQDIIESKEEKLIKPMCKVHNPKRLVELLSSFSLNNQALKYTTHSWEWGQIEDVFDTYDNFLKQVKKEWFKINKDLKEIAPRFKSKIYGFLLNEKLGEKNDNGFNKAWGENKIEFGWSSPKLKEWCSDNKKLPFDYELDKELKKEVNGQDIEKFGDIVKLFKQEIEVKSDLISLKKIFRDIVSKNLGSDFNITYSEELETVDFYTDVHWLKIGIQQIFEEIKKRTQYPNIVIEATSNIEKREIEIRIIQKESVSDRGSKEMFERANVQGNISEIKKAFCSLCDWSVESKFRDGNYRINFLADEIIENIEPLKNEPIGFIHILRFYK